jgi:hypothetical protein
MTFCKWENMAYIEGADENIWTFEGWGIIMGLRKLSNKEPHN